MKTIFNLIINKTNGQHIIMNTLKSNLFLLLLGVLAGTSLNAQEKQKGIATFVIYQEFDFPVETLWETVALDYGNIINSHPAIYSSVYTKGHTEGQLGAQRKLEFNKKGTKALTETIVSWDPENYTYNVQLDQADGFPINEEVTLATLTFKSLGPNRSSFQFDFSYGTTPKFMAGLAKGRFKSLLQDYMIALEHYILTGEQVNATTGNFKDVKKAFKARHANVQSNRVATN